MRILVTGSRDWDDKRAVRDALEDVLETISWDEDVVLVHGDCPTGADRHADEWAKHYGAMGGVTPEPHPADWDTHGRAAGPIRNSEMVAAGADLCLAFIKNGSRGATDCADKAEAAGIETRRFTA